MIDETSEVRSHVSGTPRWIALALIVPVVVSVCALWFSASTRQSAGEQARSLQAGIHQVQQQLAESDRERHAAEAQFSAVAGQLQQTRGALGATQRENTQLKKKLADVEGNVSAVREELTTKANGADVDAISKNVKGVRSDVDSVGTEVKGVRSDLDATNQKLNMARSELGTLIARNHDEIDQLRRLGQREYFEFTLEGKGQTKQVGGVTVELRGTNSKRQLCSLKLIVDDVTHVRKNRAINEPIFFRRVADRQTLEVVINHVEENKVSGYLSVPKYPAPAVSSGE